MLSYSATGARFGIGFFIPFVVLTFVIGFVVQEMTVRLGAVTHRGHAELIFDRFGKFWGFFAMGDLVLGNFLTLVTEFIGVRAGLGFFGVRPVVAVGGALVIVVGAITTGRYWTWERITLGLAIFNGLFVPAAILARPDWFAVGPRVADVDAAARRKPVRNSLADSCGYRRDRHAVDAFFPAERRGG